MRRVFVLVMAGVVLAVPAFAGSAAAPALHFRIFARTGLRLTDIVWTGRQFLYVENTTNRVSASGPSGAPLRPFAQMPRQVEETRCRLSPGAHGFVAGAIYCHAPDNTVYRISPDGKRVSVFAVLPHSPRSDGALAFDTVGRFGYALVVATGRSGSAQSTGGSVFAITALGAVRRIGAYQGPGGADEIAIAPADFGSASGDVLLAVDAGSRGSLAAMDAHGRARSLLTLPDGPNPLAVLAPGPAMGTARAGLYVTDTLSRNVYFAPASELYSFAGTVIVGSELRGLFWAVRPKGQGFTATSLQTTLAGKHNNLEGALYLGS